MRFDPATLRHWFGNIDIYLFDQLLKGRFTAGMKVLDAGCGGGRNLVFFLHNGFDAYGIDRSARSIVDVRRLAASISPSIPPSNFSVEEVQELSFADESFDVVISSAVLHFAADEEEFDKMMREMWRVLKPNGIFFSRLASTIGIEQLVEPLGGRRFLLPDDSERFLVDQEYLLAIASKIAGEMIEPIKTTNVQNLRAMTTWCMRKA